MRIKYIVPFPFDEVGLANRAAQLPAELFRAFRIGVSAVLG